MAPQHCVDTSEETFIVASCAKHELLIKHLKKRWLLDMFNQLNGLVIVFKFDTTPVDTFFRVLLLFFCEHVLVELLLQLFVCVVNVQLLKSIFCENLESKDV